MGREEAAPVFMATPEDMADSFGDFVEAIDARLAGPGICKIIPPKGWTPRKRGYSKSLDWTIPHPIKQVATGSRGLYRLLLVSGKAQSLADDFAPMAQHPENQPPAGEGPPELERRFWRSLGLRAPLYGADVEGSLFDEDLKGWNLRHLDSLLTRTLEAKKVVLPGVTTPYLYFGTWRSVFAWHTEDVDLHSVNYLHYGAPKSWYCIPPAHRARFELLLKGMLPELSRGCPEFIRHKDIVVSPELLRAHSIPVVRLVQYPGEWVISGPGAYHSGFNHGYNCAESVNFATSSWLPFGAVARPCECRDDTVQIQMTLFLDAACPKHKQAILDAMSSEEESSEEEEDGDEASCSEESGAEQGGPSGRGGSREGSSAASSSGSHFDSWPKRKRPARAPPRKQPGAEPRRMGTSPGPSAARAAAAAVAEKGKAARDVRAQARLTAAASRDKRLKAEHLAEQHQARHEQAEAQAAQAGTRGFDPMGLRPGLVAAYRQRRPPMAPAKEPKQEPRSPQLLASETDSQASQQDALARAAPSTQGSKQPQLALPPLAQGGLSSPPSKSTRSTESLRLRSGTGKGSQALLPASPSQLKAA